MKNQFRYILQLYNRNKKLYVDYWTGYDLKIVERMFDNDEYCRGFSRRILKTSAEILRRSRGETKHGIHTRRTEIDKE